MRKLRFGLVSFLILIAIGMLSVHAASKKTAVTKKTTAIKNISTIQKTSPGKKLAVSKKNSKKTGKNRYPQLEKDREPITRASSDKLIVDSRITATRKLLAQEKGHTLVNHQRGSVRLSSINFPELAESTPPPPRITSSVAQLSGLDQLDPMSLSSSAVYVLDQSTRDVLFEKNADIPLPIASVTKLMTGIVIVEALQDMSDVIEITKEDASRAPSSRLKVGTKATRGNLLHLTLMSSENRAAATLGRNYPGGYSAFVAAMNIKARMLGMNNTQYVDTTGLSSNNVASAADLAKLVMEATQYPILRQFSTDTGYVINDGFKRVHYGNTNRLVHNPNMNIELQKTGFISAAGNCLVMQAVIDERPIIMVFLDAKGKDSRIADVMKIRNWIQKSEDDNLQVLLEEEPHI